MRLIDRLTDRYRQGGYWEGMASGSAVLMTGYGDERREAAVQTLVSSAQESYRTNGVVFAIIQIRMALLSEATFKFRDKRTKKLYGTEDLRILEFPWPNGTTGDLWARMEQEASLAGNAFFAQVEDDQLLHLPAIETTIVSEEVTSSRGVRYRNVIGYDWDPSRGTIPDNPKAQFFTVDEVSHWAPIPDPNARWRGMSWLTPLLREIGADSGMTFYKTAYLDHGTPITAIRYPTKLKPETVDSIASRVQAKYGGVSNAFRPLVLDQGADPTIGGGLKDLDFANVQALGMDRICAAGSVDPIILGLRGPTPAESYAAAVRRFGDFWARTEWRSACAALQKLVPNMPPKGVDLWFDTTDIAALQAAETERAQVNQVLAAAILTVVQAGYTRDSAIAAMTSGDLTLLVPDPNAPTPGVNERQTIQVHEGVPVTGPESGTTSGDIQQSAEVSIAKPSKAGVVPAGSTLTKPQTAASKTPMPSAIKTPPSANGRH